MVCAERYYGLSAGLCTRIVYSDCVRVKCAQKFSGWYAGMCIGDVMGGREI